jgi:hypothetical protein
MRNRNLQQLAAVGLAVLAAASTAARADTSINGLAFADFTYKQNKDKATNVKSSDSGVGTDVKRFYFTVTHEFDKIWSAQFQTDIGDQGTRRYDVFVKKAYIKAKLDDALSILLGSANTPWVPYVEDVYGYRYVENELVDRLNFGTSADWGVHANGAFGNKVVLYDVAADNGRGYSNPTRSKSVDFEGRLTVQPIAGLHFAVGGYSGKRGLATYSLPALHTATRFDAMAAFVNPIVRIGGEYFQANNWNNVTSAAKDKADGFSAWASITPGAGALSIFGRWDTAKPSKTLKPNLKDTYFDVGLQWRANKSFAGSLVYKYEEIKGGTFATSNGTIGSTSASNKGNYNEFGVWTVYSF